MPFIPCEIKGFVFYIIAIFAGVVRIDFIFGAQEIPVK